MVYHKLIKNNYLLQNNFLLYRYKLKNIKIIIHKTYSENIINSSTTVGCF